MIKLILILSFFLLSLIGFAQTQEQGFTIKATLVNALNDKGKVRFALYNSEVNYLERKPTATAVEPIKNGVSYVEFNNLKPGTYAIICFHDVNENGKMDFQENGMPLEDYGMSNNITSFGPPQFKEGKFELTNANLSLEIKF